jgi:hypothetical protein
MEKMTDRVSWIKDLVRAEEQMEESGMVEVGGTTENERQMAHETLKFLQTLKNEFIESASVFNEMKASALGRIKIYGVAKTTADFMLFRNGFKMIFAMSSPGCISVRFNFIGPNYIPSQIPTAGASSANVMDEHLLQAQAGPFGDLSWTYQNHVVKMESIVRYYVSLFIRESTR